MVIFHGELLVITRLGNYSNHGIWSDLRIIFFKDSMYVSRVIEIKVTIYIHIYGFKSYWNICRIPIVIVSSNALFSQPVFF